MNIKKEQPLIEPVNYETPIVFAQQYIVCSDKLPPLSILCTFFLYALNLPDIQTCTLNHTYKL